MVPGTGKGAQVSKKRVLRDGKRVCIMKKILETRVLVDLYI